METAPLLSESDAGAFASTVQGVQAVEKITLTSPNITGVVHHYGELYGPKTWYETPAGFSPTHVDAAAHAAVLAVSRGAGIYNIAKAGGAVDVTKAVAELGFDDS